MWYLKYDNGTIKNSGERTIYLVEKVKLISEEKQKWMHT
jgi:hypothetical protein